MRLSSRIAFNTIIQIIGKIASTIVALFAVAVMTRYLGQAGFGQYTTIITFLSFFGIIADLGLTLVTVQMISDPAVNQNKILSNLFSLRIASAIVFLGLAPLVILFFPYEPIIKIGVAITTLSFFFIALNQILTGLYQKNLKMGIVSISEVLGRIALLAGVILAVLLKYGLIGIMVATVISSAVNFIINFYFSRRFAKITILIDFDVWLEIIKKSWPLALTIFFNLIYLKSDTLILSLLKTQSEVGIYGASYKVVDVLITLPFLFAGIILPILTASWLNQDFARFKNVLQKSFNAMAILAIPLLVGTLFVAEPIMVLVAGKEFAASGGILKILIFATSIIFMGCLFAHAVIAIDKQKKMIGAYIFTALTALVGYLVFIPQYSYFGAAWVTVYSELIIAMASFFLVFKYTSFRPNLNIALKSFLASLVMSIFIFFLIAKVNLIFILLLSIIIYFITLYIFKGLSRQDLMDLLNK